MRARAALPVLIFSSLVFLSGCWLIGTVAEAGCGAASGSAEDHCYKWAAEQQGDPDACARIKAQSEKGVAPLAQCYEDVAVRNGDPDICDRITEISFISTTREKCLLQVAAKVRDPKICDRLSLDDRATCFKIMGQDPAQCERNWATVDAGSGGCKCVSERMQWSTEYKTCRCRPEYAIQTAVSGDVPSCFTVNEYITNGGGPAGADPCGSLPDTPERERCVFSTARHTGQCHYMLDSVKLADCYVQVASAAKQCDGLDLVITLYPRRADEIRARQDACYAKFK
jgi:hypothetical protein